MSALPSIRWTRPRALAALAFGLGVVALAGNPVQGRVARIDTQELATAIASGADRVSADELAGWIVRGASDYRLVDVRTPAEFAAFHVPTAENLPVADLFDGALARNEKIVVIGDDGARSAQAWVLLRARGFGGARLLEGGLAAWRDQVMYPRAPRAATAAESLAFLRVAQRALSFGGAPRAAAGDSAAPLAKLSAVPHAAPPPPPASPVARPAGAAPKKEGC